MDAEQAYLFRHAVLRDAAYELQTPGQRALLHRTAALLIHDYSEGKPKGEFAEEVCRHVRIARDAKDTPELHQIELTSVEAAVSHTTRNWRHRDALSYLQRMAEIGPPEQRIRALASMGTEHQFLGEIDKSIEVQRRAVGEAEPGSKDWRLTRRALGRTLFLADQLDESERLLRECADECRRSGDVKVLLMVLNDLASVLQRRARMEEARPIYEEAIDGYISHPDLPGLGNVLSNLGTLYFETGQFDKAAEYYRRALDAHRETDQHHSAGITLANLGAILRLLGDANGAERHYHEAIEVHGETGDVGHLADVYGKLANLYSQQGRNHEALELYFHAVASERERGASVRLGLLLSNLGILYTAMERSAESEESFREALEILEGFGNQRLIAAAEGGLAENLLRSGRVDEALPLVRSSMQRAEDAKDPVGAALGQLTLGACLRLQDKLSESETELRAAIERLEQLHDMAGVGAGRCSLAITLHRRGEGTTALEDWNAGKAALEKANDLQSLKMLQAEWDELTL
jgi:tetratricopeptide (TPR) repeat protein